MGLPICSGARPRPKLGRLPLRGVTVLGLSETVGHRCTDSGRLAVTTNRLGSAQAAEYLLRPTCIGKGMVKVGGRLWQAWVEWVG